eukprot:TRINITY_DN17230_c0_g2_i1.p1 TRINITY_DN17230_c0_g2~~TRINITY_DN17230_c0_g2_i1.p1  ORF type:complete len:197 (+),score=32.07 TRINITY_DN17230_c0_g2_i1:42-632(+)
MLDKKRDVSEKHETALRERERHKSVMQARKSRKLQENQCIVQAMRQQLKSIKEKRVRNLLSKSHTRIDKLSGNSMSTQKIRLNLSEKKAKLYYKKRDKEWKAEKKLADAEKRKMQKLTEIESMMMQELNHTRTGKELIMAKLRRVLESQPSNYDKYKKLVRENVTGVRNACKQRTTVKSSVEFAHAVSKSLDNNLV